MDRVDQNYEEELIIVNRKCEYYVSKKFICSVVPYFKKLFSGDELESRENKVTLDFDESAFDALLNWLHSGLFVMQMDYVINFYAAAKRLRISKRLFKPCFEYFHKNFTIKYLPLVLTQVKKSSKLINLEVIDIFICRHFLKIANTDTFLDYPVETLEHILKLDLMIYSEYQVFESIRKWVNKNTDSRKEFLSKLLRLVRWSFMDPVGLSKIKENEFIKALKKFDSGFNRTQQNFFVSIQELDHYSKIRINIFDKDLFCLPIGDFTLDDTMPLELFHGEHISDILFDSGKLGIRIDWNQKTFIGLNIDNGETYYTKMHQSIVNFQDDRREYSCYLDDQATELPDDTPANEYLLLEYNDGFVCIGETLDDKRFFGIFPVTDPNWFIDYPDHYTLHATILNNTVYLLTANFLFFQWNMETRSYNEIELVKGVDKLAHNKLILTSLPTEDDKVILVDKSTGKFHVYCIHEKKWFEKYQIFNVNPDSKDSYFDFDKLVAFTSTFLPIKNIKPLFRRNFL
ncbi:uncharacterized protein LOC107360989 [Tetranychus urticae]|uniref:uncharacterized protein LOC107360989 n=1 Tax=Tetranychus urticae TaxID=32264 RepID=UPI00077BC8AE|nr:uncharacterized protein LOC107360989 [Tetranychus urticae]